MQPVVKVQHKDVILTQAAYLHLVTKVCSSASNRVDELEEEVKAQRERAEDAESILRQLEHVVAKLGEAVPWSSLPERFKTALEAEAKLQDKEYDEEEEGDA
jgi:hypothetical protein